jgi:RNA polymerase sigma factor (sigma-70 family)
MAYFPQTQWSLVAAALESGAGTAVGTRQRQALDKLCQVYWYPLYAYARSFGHSHQDAEDLTQTLFAYLLEEKRLAGADPESVRFRTFLLTHFKYVISNRWRAQTAQKRGAQFEHLSIDIDDADERFQALQTGGQDPARIFDRVWAGQVVDQAIGLLEVEYSLHNTDVPFEALRGFLPGGSAQARVSYAELEHRYAPVTQAALMTRVHRLKKRLPELLLAVITETVRDPAEAQEELRYLIEVLAAA